MPLTIIAYGAPAPQGSKKGFVNRKTGGVILVEASGKVKPWRQSVLHAALEARDGGLPLDGPLTVRMVFSLPRPKGHYGSGKKAGIVKDSAPKRPATTPDLSKLARSTEDALTDAGVWADDSRVTEYDRLAKVFVNEDVDALDAPGVRIVIERIEA